MTVTTCEGCGGACCKFLTIAADWLAIAHVEDEFLTTRGVLDDDGAWRLNLRCRYLETDGLCTIYDDRPHTCRVYEVGGYSCLKARKADGVE